MRNKEIIYNNGEFKIEGINILIIKTEILKSKKDMI